MGEIQKLYVTLGLNASEFARGIEGAAQRAGAFAQNLRGRVGAALGTVASIGRTAFLGVGVAAAAGFGAAMRSAINMNSSLETSTLQFTTLMGNADQATEHVKALFDFAGKTPFETGPIIDASLKLQTFGGAALNTMENLTLIGDAAAAVNAPIDELGFWVGRLYSNLQGGQPFGEAAMRLQELAVLSPEARTQMEALQEAGASADEIFTLFQGNLGQFTGAMEAQAGTWQGLTSTIKDNINLLIAGALKPFFDLLKEGLAGLAEWLQSPAVQQGIQQFAANLTALIETVALFVREQVVPFVVQHGPQLKAVLIALAVAFGALLIIGAVSTALSFLLSPIGLIVAAVGILAAAWTNNWGGIRDKVTEAWAVIQPLLAQAWEWLKVHVPAALEVLRALWVDVVWPAIQQAIEIVWPIIKEIFENIKKFIVETVIPTVKELYEKWTTEWWPTIQTVLETVWGIIEEIFTEIGRWVNDNLVPWIQYFHDKWVDEWWPAIQKALETVWGIVEPILADLRTKFETVMGAIGEAIEPAKNLIDGLKGAAEGLWNWIKNKVFNFNIHIPDLPDWAVPGSPLPIHMAWLAFARDAGRIGRELSGLGTGLERNLALSLDAAVAGRVGEGGRSQTVYIYGGYNVSSRGDGGDTLSELYYKNL